VYANGDASAERFDRTVRFRMTVIPYDGDDSWVEALVIRAKHCLDADAPPTASPGCDWCQFVRDAGELEKPRSSGVGPKAVPRSPRAPDRVRPRDMR
jgi:hypothetical protein